MREREEWVISRNGGKEEVDEVRGDEEENKRK